MCSLKDAVASTEHVTRGVKWRLNMALSHAPVGVMCNEGWHDVVSFEPNPISD